MSARCSTHGEVEAVMTCARCGRFLCEACVAPPIVDLPTPGPYCTECGAKLGAPPSRRARWSFGLGVFALAGTLVGGCIPLIHFVVLPAALVSGPVALALSLMELAAIRGGESPIRGERAARRGRTLALLHLGLVILLTIALFALRGVAEDALH